MSVECVLRQSRNSLLPVDIFELQVLVAAEADRGVVTGTDGSLYAVAPAAVRKMLAGSGPLTMAFWWTQVQEEAFLREQIVRNGRQTAQERIGRSEEHTSELQSLMRTSYAVFCLKKKTTINNKYHTNK